MNNKRINNNETINLAIGYHESVNKKDIADLEIFLRENFNSNVKSIQLKPSVQASLDWALPALIMIYLAKPFLDSFLRELGSKSGKAFVSYLSKLIKRQNNKEAVWMNRHALNKVINQLKDGVPKDIVQKSGEFNPVLSFDLQLKEDHRVKMVVPFSVTKLPEEEINKIIAEIPEISNTENRLNKYLHQKRIVMYGYDLDDHKWIEDPVRYSITKSNKSN